ncbi:MAG: DUF1599 domain-containing protein [Sphingobacteriales bacterium]|jgi:hypothetical protein|nr:DUF1599 domain-containing protein [Sphingobacteriales bacterium]MBP9140197.1 DUF1599 domain-containing protein [Chitinophagales bacterium]MDA0197669.1 DUF1599 domain-containing protein [Bacteroidota bacterium]MBK6888972.1 DUF1599 domain-containing protein [Sphingobacteriales bacterium]MBK7528526.1 DUF1599 domain-containing protein [Sphingobacteriales bacterium]
MHNTLAEFKAAIDQCRHVFTKKSADYGSAWRILRPSSLTDQLFIKAQRIRTIQEKGNAKINEGIEQEFTAIVNYCIMALVQVNAPADLPLQLTTPQALQLYDAQVNHAVQLLEAKNHDYGDAWRSMRISSFTDLILMKLYRIKQIEDNSGQTIASEGVESGYLDILNYAVFGLILLNKNNT